VKADKTGGLAVKGAAAGKDLPRLSTAALTLE
jgi:hypothetical protein